MFIFDISNPLTLLLMLAVTVLLIFLSQEVKQSFIGAIMLFAYLIILVVHVAQISTLSEEYRYLLSTLSRCIVIDFIFVFITFFSFSCIFSLFSLLVVSSLSSIAFTELICVFNIKRKRQKKYRQ